MSQRSPEIAEPRTPNDVHECSQVFAEKGQLLQDLLQPRPEVIVVSGGPCGGKSTLLEGIQEAAANQELPIRIVPEVATWVMEQGIDLGYLAMNDRQQYVTAQKQIAREYLDRITQAQAELAGTNGLIICDRGPKDSFAYTTEEEAAEVAGFFGYESAANFGHDLVDKVVYMPSIAVTSPNLYEELKATNAARYENAEQAAVTCQRTFLQWASHPELHIAESDDFTSKIELATQFCLAADQEYEQKWSVTNETAQSWIAEKELADDLLNTIHITQSYHQHDGASYRLRRGQSDAGTFYHFAIKEKTPSGNREVRRQISAEDYELLGGAGKTNLTKVRHVVRDGNQIWHCDFIHDPHNGQGFWIFEAETASTAALINISPPLKGMQSTDFDTKHFAEKGNTHVDQVIHRDDLVISKRWKWASVIGNFAIGLAELATGNISTLAVAADGLHNVGDAATYYMQAENVLDPSKSDTKKNKWRKAAHWIIAASSLAVSAKAGVDLAYDRHAGADPVSIYAAVSSLALNAGLWANLHRKKRKRKQTDEGRNNQESVHEKDLSKHLWAVDMPSAGLELLGAVAQKYNIEIEQVMAAASGLIGAYVFRPTDKNLNHHH